VVIFRNWFFNVNMLLFTLEYIYFRNQADNSNLELIPFNPRHTILHISILLGGFIQLALAPRLDLENEWVSALIIVPFLLLKILIDKPLLLAQARLLN